LQNVTTRTAVERTPTGTALQTTSTRAAVCFGVED
jgi:hypothetical protein